MLFFPNSHDWDIFYSVGLPLAAIIATRRLKRSLVIYETSTNIFCHVAGKAFSFNSFRSGYSISLLFSSILAFLSFDFYSIDKDLYNFDCA